MRVIKRTNGKSSDTFIVRGGDKEVETYFNSKFPNKSIMIVRNNNTDYYPQYNFQIIIKK